MFLPLHIAVRLFLTIITNWFGSLLKNWRHFRFNRSFSLQESETRSNLFVPCRNCDQRYIGETKRCLETRHKEHLADVKHRRFDRSALTRHVFDVGHSIDWQ